MTCGSCGGAHIGQCPGVRRTCRGCQTSYIAGNGWHNHFYCSTRCCAIRRAELAPPQDEEDCQ